MSDAPNTWPDLAIALYDRLTGRGAAITYTFDDMRIEVPQGLGDDAPSAAWKLNGSLIITTEEPKGQMPLRVHGRVTLEVDGEAVHLAASGAAWTATVSRFRTLRRLASQLPPLPHPIGRPDPATLPTALAQQGITLQIRDARGPLLELGSAAASRRLRVPFLLDVPHARVTGPWALLRLLF